MGFLKETTMVEMLKTHCSLQLKHNEAVAQSG